MVGSVWFDERILTKPDGKESVKICASDEKAQEPFFRSGMRDLAREFFADQSKKRREYLVYSRAFWQRSTEKAPSRRVSTTEKAVPIQTQERQAKNLPLLCSHSQYVHKKHLSILCLYYTCFLSPCQALRKGFIGKSQIFSSSIVPTHRDHRRQWSDPALFDGSRRSAVFRAAAGQRP